MDTNANSSSKKYYDANSFSINGRLTRDPEIRVAPSGKQYAVISIANNRGDNTNFFTFFAAEAQIPFVSACLRKGCAIDVSGTILPQVDTMPDGKKITNYKLIASKFALVANPKGATGSQMTQTVERPMTPPAQQPTYQQTAPQPNYGQPQYQQNAPQQGYQQPPAQPQYQGGYATPTNSFGDDDLPF